jgi:RNA polymerase sigma factor (sigma-70 family)
VAGARLRDLEEIYRVRYRTFLRLTTAITGDVDAGHDAVQEGFASALRHRGSYRGDGPLEAWVWRAVVNAARRARRVDAPVALDEAAARNGTSPDVSGVRAWVSALPERQRLAVFLRYYADLDYRSIADVLDVEVGTVSATLSSAHAALRKRLANPAR